MMSTPFGHLPAPGTISPTSQAQGKATALRSLRATVTSLLLLAGLGFGCASRPSLELAVGPEYHPANIYGQNAPLSPALRRVALLPVSGPADPRARATPASALGSELARTRHFELVPVSAEMLESWTGQRAWSPSAALPVALAAHLRQDLGCDGVLLSELSQYRPYPPLAVGWNLKLVDLQAGQIVWAADEVFDASQTAVANSARRYRLRHSQLPGSLEDSRFILLSPEAFSHYTADTLFATLPAYALPENPPKVFSAPVDKKRSPKDHPA